MANDNLCSAPFFGALVVLTKTKFTRSKEPAPSSKQPLYQWTHG